MCNACSHISITQSVHNAGKCLLIIYRHLGLACFMGYFEWYCNASAMHLLRFVISRARTNFSCFTAACTDGSQTRQTRLLSPCSTYCVLLALHRITKLSDHLVRLCYMYGQLVLCNLPCELGSCKGRRTSGDE
jgi:hypothetical protein